MVLVIFHIRYGEAVTYSTDDPLSPPPPPSFPLGNYLYYKNPYYWKPWFNPYYSLQPMNPYAYGNSYYNEPMWNGWFNWKLRFWSPFSVMPPQPAPYSPPDEQTASYDSSSDYE